jgi:hypothetical protein
MAVLAKAGPATIAARRISSAVIGLFSKNISGASDGEWLRVTDPPSGARLCEAQQAGPTGRSGNYF